MERGKLLLQFVNEHRSKSELDYYKNAYPVKFNIFDKKLLNERKDMKDFMQGYLDLILTKSPMTEWEMDNRSGRQPAIKLIDDVNILIAHSDIDVYDFGKQGMEIVFKKLPEGPKLSLFQKSAVDIFSIKALPACETMFYRDWNKGGICVHQTEEYDEPW
jgi:hypothetical protein